MTQYKQRAIPVDRRAKVRSDAKVTEVVCPVCSKSTQLLASVAKNRKTCGQRECTNELKRRNAKAQAPAIADRFKMRVEKQSNGCWLWTGNMSKGGYGVIVIDGKPVRAHRLSYTLHRGEIPEGLFICHHCDNPSCVNPDHLYAGTHQQNMDDRTRRGRNHIPRGVAPRGAGNGMAKLNGEKVLEIKTALSSKSSSQSELARKYGVDPSLISKISSGVVWGYLDEAG